MNLRKAFSSSIFCRNDGRVLLIKHKRLNLWLPVGGELEVNETPLEAAKRELFEETGLRGNFPKIPGEPFGSPPGFLAYEEHLVGSKGLHLNFAFLADVPHRYIQSDGSFTEARWVTAEEAESLETTRNVLDLLKYIESLG